MKDMNERFERFAVRLGVACGMVALCLTAGAWDVEHDEIAQLTGECLPVEIKAQFDFDDFGALKLDSFARQVFLLAIGADVTTFGCPGNACGGG